MRFISHADRAEQIRNAAAGEKEDSQTHHFVILKKPRKYDIYVPVITPLHARNFLKCSVIQGWLRKSDCSGQTVSNDEVVFFFFQELISSRAR